MNAADVLVRQLERQQDSFLKMVKQVPPDKLNWSPKEGMRSALDQFQEVATIVGHHWHMYEQRKLEWTEEGFAEYKRIRSKLTTVEELEASLRADTAKLVAFTRGLPAADLAAPVDMPFPGEHLVVDNITYHVYNMAYHEGQIAYILMLLGIEISF